MKYNGCYVTLLLSRTIDRLIHVASLLSFIPEKAAKKIEKVQAFTEIHLFNLLFIFSFISYLQICFLISLRFHRPIGQHAYISFLAWLEHFV